MSEAGASMRNNWLILLLDENKVTGEIRDITQAVRLGRFVLCNASWCLKFQMNK